MSLSPANRAMTSAGSHLLNMTSSHGMTVPLLVSNRPTGKFQLGVNRMQHRLRGLHNRLR